MALSKNLISFIFSYQYSKSREPLLYVTLDNLEKAIKPYITNYYFEICVHEVGIDSTFAEERLASPLYRYLFTYNPSIFSRAWVLNTGVRHLASGNLLCLLDADILYTSEWVTEVLKCTTPSFGWRKLHYLDQQATTNFLKSSIINTKQLTKRGIRKPSILGAAGGATIIPTNIYYEIGGIPEDFTGAWGGNDNALALKLKAYGYPLETLPCDLYHLYHEKGEMGNRELHKKLKEMKTWTLLDWKKHTENSKNWGSLRPPVIKHSTTINATNAINATNKFATSNRLKRIDKSKFKRANKWRHKSEKWIPKNVSTNGQQTAHIKQSEFEVGVLRTRMFEESGKEST
jgi:GT2 family glycosyltransferase